jgi:hypothetical protein
MRWLSIAVLSVYLVVGRSSVLYSQEKKPNTQITEVAGRSLEYWISVIPLKDQSNTENAIRAVMMFGPDRAYQAVPVILDRLRKHTAQAPVDLSVRVNGVIALGYILGGYRDDKGQAMTDPQHVKDAVIILKRFLADSQSILRYRAAQALGRIGPDAKSAIAEVINVTKDTTTFETRQAAAISLGQIAYDPVKGPSLAVLNALYARLGDGSVLVRLAAIQSLSWLGGPLDNKLRVSLVVHLNPVSLQDPEPSVRIWCNMAIMSITKTIDKNRVDAIAKLLAHADVAARVQAAQALGTIGKDAKETIPALLTTLRDPDITVVGYAVWALGRMEHAAGGALQELERIKADTTQPEWLRKMAEEAIEHINGKKAKVIAPAAP